VSATCSLEDSGLSVRRGVVMGGLLRMGVGLSTARRRGRRSPAVTRG
jgi:hypothetical protein